MDNEKITKDKILYAHRNATIKRIQKEKIVLFVQDIVTIIKLALMSAEIGGRI